MRCVLDALGATLFAHVERVCDARDARVARHVAERDKLTLEIERQRITIRAQGDELRALRKIATERAVDAMGKTPGQVLEEAYNRCPPLMSATNMREAAASAVLDAFGGNALRRVRNVIAAPRPLSSSFTFRDEALSSIDAELCKFGSSGA